MVSLTTSEYVTPFPPGEITKSQRKKQKQNQNQSQNDNDNEEKASPHSAFRLSKPVTPSHSHSISDPADSSSCTNKLVPKYSASYTMSRPNDTPQTSASACGSSHQSVWRRLRTTIFLTLFLAVLPRLLDTLVRREFIVHSTGSIIISGTSSGIGRATCGYLAERHTTVALYCGVRRLDNATDYPFTLPNVHAVLLDVTNQSQVEDAINQVQAPLIGIVSNAGICRLSTIEYQSMEDIEQHYQVNVFGTLRLTKTALPLLRRNKGRVLWISSASTLVKGSMKRWGSYVGTKSVLEKMGDTLRNEVQDLGVSVSLVAPGFLKTELTDAAVRLEQELLDSLTSDGLKRAKDDSMTVVDDTAAMERQIYSSVYNREFIQLQKSLMEYGGPMEETCKAIEHGLFARLPKPRYLTARIGALPTWCAIQVTNIWPSDSFINHCMNSPEVLSLLVRLQGVRDEIENALAIGAKFLSR